MSCFKDFTKTLPLLGEAFVTGLCTGSGKATIPRYLRHMWQLKESDAEISYLIVAIQHGLIVSGFPGASGLVLHLLKVDSFMASIEGSMQVDPDYELTCDGILDESSDIPILKLVTGASGEGNPAPITYHEFKIDITQSGASVFSRPSPSEIIVDPQCHLKESGLFPICGCGTKFYAFPSIAENTFDQPHHIWVAFRVQTTDVQTCVSTYGIQLAEKLPKKWHLKKHLYGVENTSSYKYVKLVGGDGNPLLMILYDSIDPSDGDETWFSAFWFKGGYKPVSVGYDPTGVSTQFLNSNNPTQPVPKADLSATHWSVVRGKGCDDVALVYAARDEKPAHLKICDSALGACGCVPDGGCPAWASAHSDTEVGPLGSHYPGTSINENRQIWIPLGGGEIGSRQVVATLMGQGANASTIENLPHFPYSQVPARVSAPERLHTPKTSYFIFSWSDQLNCDYIGEQPVNIPGPGGILVPVEGYHMMLGKVSL